MTGLNKMSITKLCSTKLRYHSSLNLLLFFYLFFKSSFDSLFKSIYRPFSKSASVCSIESFSTSFLTSSSKSSPKSSSSVPSSLASIKKLRKIHSLKWQFLIFLLLIFNCFGQLNANPSRSLTLDSPSNLSSNLSFHLTNSKKNESIFTLFSSYLMSFVLSNSNNTHNQVINQLSILNQPSNSSELELFKQVHLLNNKNIKEINGEYKSSNKSEITSSSSVINGSTVVDLSKDQSINGHSNVPLHKLMFEDEMKLFFNDLNINPNSKETNSNQLNEQLINQDFEDNSNKLHYNGHSNDELMNYLTKFSDKNSENLNEDYELLEADEIKSYPNIFKSKFKNPKQLRLSFNLFNERVELDLELNNRLFSPNFVVQKSASKLSKDLELNNLNCFYHGRLSVADSNESTQFSDFKNRSKTSSNEPFKSNKKFIDSIVSLSICNDLRGFIQTENYLYLLNPLTEQLIRRFNLANKKQVSNVLLIKRTKTTNLIKNLTKQITNQVFAKKVNTNLNSTQNEELIRNDESSENDRLKNQKRIKRNAKNHNSRLDPTIELAVFADEALYLYLKNTYFIKTDHQIVTFILTILNGIQTLYNQFQKYDINLKFNIVLLEIMQKQPRDLIPSDLQEKYLFRFCDWQAKRKYENTKSKYGSWDHSILLTGLDLARYDKETKTKVDSVIGSAIVGSMCKENSCSIGEGTLLGAVLVMSHEIGHSMDLSHDGDIEHSGFNNCENEKYIMTSSLGPGVYLFSKCSARELKSYLKKPIAKCLFVNNSKLRLNKKFLNDFHIMNEDDVLGSWARSKYLPGQVYSIDDQCALQFGSKSFYAPTKYYSLCEAVTCRLNSTFEGIRYAHPTLEGTSCGHEMWCKKGECVRSSLREIDSKDILNNEIISSNPYSIDLSAWKSDKRRQMPLTTTANKPKWKVFENNYDTSVDQILLNSRLKNNLTILNNFRINSNLTNYWISLFDKKNNTHYLNGLNDLKNLNSLYQNSNGHSGSITNNDLINNQGWSNWSMWSECVSECIIASNQDRMPIGFHVSTRKCLLNSGCSIGNRIRLKLCDATKICSSRSQYQLKMLDQYVNEICDLNGNPIINRQSTESTVNGCFIKSCPNNELTILSHELQLPNTSPCSADGSTGLNSYCFNGECRHFDCSGFSEANTSPCKDKTVGFVAVEEEESSVNEWHPLSYCKQSCLYNSQGIQLAYQDCGANECSSSLEKQSFKLCSTAEEDCLERELRTVNDYANEICTKYKLKYPTLLSGKGKQLAPRKDNLHSACIVSCSDLNLSNVYYEMNNILDGYLPLGTNCTFNSSIKSYCINGRCVQFDHDLTPIDKSVNTFKNLRREFTREMMFRNRHR